jgi:hypothetical protein
VVVVSLTGRRKKGVGNYAGKRRSGCIFLVAGKGWGYIRKNLPGIIFAPMFCSSRIDDMIA